MEIQKSFFYHFLDKWFFYNFPNDSRVSDTWSSQKKYKQEMW